MNKNLLLLTLLFSSLFALSQTSVQINANNVKALIPSTPILFWDGVNSSVFNVPKSGTNSTIFTSTPWIGGINNKNIYLAAETYRQNGSDFQTGPIGNVIDTSAKWTVVKVTSTTINLFKADTSYWSNPPAEIANWPAHGDTTKGQAFHLAPFVNVGGDPYLYEPHFGDYPKIKGDQCTYYIFNDNKVHQESGGLSMKVEVHRMVYALIDTASYLNNTVFVEYKLFNRSNLTYDSSIFSVYTDFDIGYYADDFIGTDTSSNMVFAYNGDINDNPGYGFNPPAEGMIVLNHPLYSSMFYQNDNTRKGNPNSTPDFYNYMNAKWRDNSDLTFGDSGVAGFTKTMYAYSGNVCNQNGWTEGNALSVPGDRRMLGNVSLGSFKPNETRNIDFAYVYGRGTSGPVSSYCAMFDDAQKVKSYYDSHLLGVKNLAPQLNELSIYPNPTNNAFTVSSTQKIQVIEVYNIAGQLIQTISNPGKTSTIDGLNAGIYFVKVSGKESSEIRKVIVQ